MTEITQAELNRIGAAQEYVHKATCPRGDQPGPCAACPSPSAVHAALRVLDERPRDARGARQALHDAVCMSDFCGGLEGDHADRTQTSRAAALRKFRAAEATEVGEAIPDLLEALERAVKAAKAARREQR